MAVPTNHRYLTFSGTKKRSNAVFTSHTGVRLNNVDNIKPTAIAVVGLTGAGKSTMIKLLARLYDVDNGSVKIDGIDIKDIAISELRKNIMLVPQDVFLFTGTIMENIRYGKPNTVNDEVNKASIDSCANNFI